MNTSYYKGLIIFLLLSIYCCSGAAAEYNSYNRRDPFVPLVGITETGSSGGVGSILTIEDVALQGIVVYPGGVQSAIINGELMKEGDKIGRIAIESIGSNAVTILIEGQKHEVQLYKD